MRLRYGPGRGQFGVLHRPEPTHDLDCVVVFVHGGFWRWPFNRWVTSLLARDAARRGFTAFNIEYRRLGRLGGGGGWPETFDDVADAVAVVAKRFESARILLVGHSAGGHLALVTSARLGPIVDGVVSMSAPTDLRLLSETGSEPVDALVAGTPVASRWSLTSPIEMVPIGIPTLCVHGEADSTVRPDMSIRYVRAAIEVGDVVLIPNEGHRSALLPWSETWRATVETIERWCSDDETSSRSDRCLTKDGG